MVTTRSTVLENQQMSITTTPQKAVTDVPATEIDLPAVVAQTTSTGGDVPHWDVFNACCQFTLETVRRHSEGQ